MAKQVNEYSKEEIIESINEWPVTDYNSSPTDKIDNPDSVSAFFLRNVGKPKSQKSPNKTRKTDDNSEEVDILVDVALAKWWRKNGKDHKTIVENICSQDPNTVISIVSRSDAGVEFIQSEIKRLRSKVGAGLANASVSSALASFYEKLGNLSIAKMHLEGALEKDPDNKEMRWRMLRLKRAIQCRRQQEMALVELDFNSSSELTLPRPKEVRRVSADQLSVKDFFYHHALPGIPLVITGLVSEMTSTPWTLQHIAQVAGACKAQLKRCVKQSSQWARLEDASESSVSDFIDSLSRTDAQPEKLYLFDWSIPIHCPKLAEELTIPKYFAGDFLQRTSPGSYYQDSWPSLFIAPAGITSELHVDAFGSNFWMALFEGRKRWTFYNKDDTFKLYPSYENPLSSDPVFQVDLNLPDNRTFPLLSQAETLQCVLEPGEVLFVPAGSPHRVENLETSLAISGNFVDLSNYQLVKDELSMTSLIDERSHDLYKQLSDPDFKSDMNSSLGNLPWEEYKSWKNQDYNQCDITEECVNKILAEQKDNKGQC